MGKWPDFVCQLPDAICLKLHRIDGECIGRAYIHHVYFLLFFSHSSVGPPLEPQAAVGKLEDDLRLKVQHLITPTSGKQAQLDGDHP
jgi:hypothetical protein